MNRCYNPNNPAYSRYGGRGIKVCERWRKIENFIADMGQKPEGKSIDRIDNNGNYSPENCRWATHKEQMNNKRNNRILIHNGLSLTMAQWAEKLNTSSPVLCRRLNNYKWTIKKALSTPIIKKPRLH